MEINAKEARRKFSSLLDQVEGGEEVVIRRRGREVARLIPPRGRGKCLPRLKKFRASIRIQGEPLSGVIKRGRAKERY